MASSDEHHRPFVYDLLESPDQFRVFYIAPGEGDELYGYLESVTWGSHPPYEALSYVWGSDEKPHVLNLIVDDFQSLRQFRITTSLYNALRKI